MILCPGNDGIGIKCPDSVKTLIPGITAEGALILKFDSDTSLELHVVWFLSMVWKLIWGDSSNENRPALHKIRSEMEATFALPRTIRSYVNYVITMDILVKCQIYQTHLGM